MTPPPVSPAARSRSVAIVVLLAVAIGSALGGAAIDRALISRTPPQVAPDTGFHPLSSALRSPSEADRQRIRGELSRSLSLTPDQNRVIDSILDHRAAQFEELRASMRPRVESLLTDVRSDIVRVLTPEQAEKYRQLRGQK
jgi:hypothetical protein